MGFLRYCYWSIATAAYAERMQTCVDSARACGVFKDFHVLTSRPLRGCECYDLMEFQRQGVVSRVLLGVGDAEVELRLFCVGRRGHEV